MRRRAPGTDTEHGAEVSSPTAHRRSFGPDRSARPCRCSRPPRATRLRTPFPYQLLTPKTLAQTAAHSVISFFVIIGAYGLIFAVVALVTGSWYAGWAFPVIFAIVHAAIIVWSRRRQLGSSPS